IRLDEITRLGMHRRDRGRLWRFQAQLHFHRFDHDELLTGLHFFAVLGFHEDDTAGHWRDDAVADHLRRRRIGERADALKANATVAVVQAYGCRVDAAAIATRN